jgi:tetratricopeptide (TPR) repeat protein
MAPATYQEAVHQFDRALSLNPQFADAYLNRGLAERNLNRPDAALTDFEKALDLDPSLTLAHDELGNLYTARGDTQKALDQFTQSIGSKPTANGLYQRGQLYEKLGQHQKAVDDYNKAIEELSDAPYIYFARSTARAALGDSAGSKADRAKGMELSVDTDKVK